MSSISERENFHRLSFISKSQIRNTKNHIGILCTFSNVCVFTKFNVIFFSIHWLCRLDLLCFVHIS